LCYAVFSKAEIGSANQLACARTVLAQALESTLEEVVMARFRSKVSEIRRTGRVVGGDMDGYPVVHCTLETGESFTIFPDEEGARWSVSHSFSVHSFEKGTDIFVLYDEMPPQKVEFFGSPEAWDRYREVGLG